MDVPEYKIKELRKRLGFSRSVIHELLVLSGGDVDMAEQASKANNGIDQCKADIINRRFRRLENNGSEEAGSDC